MRSRVIALCLLLLAVASAPLRAQYVLESHEATTFLRRQIPVGPLRVIYRAGQDSLAQAVAKWGGYYRSATAFTAQRNRQFPIIMWGQTVVPNGMVAWTPSRMELYPLTGGEERTPVPWLQHLMSHEVRHYAQMEAIDRKVVRGLYYLLGQQNVGLGAALFPNWYFEGDAIHSESKYAPFGRAHSAEHVQAYRADLLDGQPLRYDQYRFGTFRYSVPNHYSFGTLMVESAVARYGEQFWPDVVEYSVLRPFYINPVHFALKRYIQRSAPALFWDAMGSVDSIFIARTEFGERPNPVARGAYRAEREPWQPVRGRYRYLWLSDLSHTLAFLREDTATGERKLLFRPGAKMGAARYGDSLALWIEAEWHPRWGDVVWGDVYAFKLSTNRRARVTRRERLLSPVPLAGDSLFAAIGFGGGGENYVVRFRLSNGRAVDTAKLPPPGEYRELSRGGGADEILIRGVNYRGTYVLAYNWHSGAVDTLLANAVLDIGSLTPAGDSGFFFTASHNSRQQPFYARRLRGGKVSGIYRVAMRNHGVDDLHAVPGGGLDYSEYTINGYRARHTDLLDLRPCAELPRAQSLFPLAQTLPDATHGANEAPIQYPSRRYNPLLHAVRVHSWTPFYFNPFGGVAGLGDVLLGATIESQNTTGSLAFSLGYFYKERHGASFTAIWQGWWPVISANVTYGGAPRRATYRDTVLLGPHSVAASLGASVPLRFRRGAMFVSVTPRLTAAYRNDGMVSSAHDGLTWGVVDVGYGVAFDVQRLRARRDLYPRYGVRVNVGGKSRVRPLKLVGPLLEGRAVLFLPGLIVNHSLRLSGYLAKSFRAPYALVFSMPVRGLNPGYPSAELQTTHGWSAAVDYALPLGYPDWSLGCLLYLQRVYTNVAFSYTRYASLRGAARQKRAVYLDLVGDMRILRFGFNYTLGVSVGYSPWGDALGAAPWGPWSLNWIFNVSL